MVGRTLPFEGKVVQVHGVRSLADVERIDSPGDGRRLL
eukprot:s4605_g1.t1